MLLDVDPQDEVALLVNVVGGGDDAVLSDRKPNPDTCLSTILPQTKFQVKFDPLVLLYLPGWSLRHWSVPPIVPSGNIIRLETTREVDISLEQIF